MKCLNTDVNFNFQLLFYLTMSVLIYRPHIALKDVTVTCK